MDHINNHQFRHLAPQQAKKKQTKEDAAEHNQANTLANNPKADVQHKAPTEVFDHLAATASFDPTSQRVSAYIANDFSQDFSNLVAQVKTEFPAMSNGAAQRVAGAMAVNDGTI